MAVITTFWLCCLLLGPGDQPVRQMAITVDDLPVAPGRVHSTREQADITAKLLAVLTKHGVPAIGFVNEDKLEVEGELDPKRMALLEAWLEAGMELGNHGYAHLDLHRVDPQVWMDDVLRGERRIRPLIEARGGRLRYFRHPFLHTGMSLQVRAQTSEFLADHGYLVAPVTIDNQEWIFGGAYARTENHAERRKIGKAYVSYMESMVDYYEDQARTIVGPAFPQILLIHAYALNADWLERILLWLEQQGYVFVPLEEALDHPAYGSADRFTGRAGITWLHRWAITRGMPGSTFAGEPRLPQWLEQR